MHAYRVHAELSAGISAPSNPQEQCTKHQVSLQAMQFPLQPYSHGRRSADSAIAISGGMIGAIAKQCYFHGHAAFIITTMLLDVQCIPQACRILTFEHGLIVAVRTLLVARDVIWVVLAAASLVRLWCQLRYVPREERTQG